MTSSVYHYISAYLTHDHLLTNDTGPWDDDIQADDIGNMISPYSTTRWTYTVGYFEVKEKRLTLE